MIFSQKQKKYISQDLKDNDLIVAEGTPRSGKSVANAFLFARYLIQSKDIDHLILGFSAEMAYKLVIECNGFGLKYIFPFTEIKQDKLFGSHLVIKLPNGKIKRVFFKGAGKKGDSNRFQGMTLGSVFFEEINLLHIDNIQEAFRRTMASSFRIHFADLNPPSPHDRIIKEVFEVQNTKWTHWTLSDNPVMTEQRIGELKAILSKSPYLYKRDFLGERVLPEGLVYSMFSYENNRLEDLESEFEIVELFFSCDAGLQDATVCQCWLVGVKKEDRRVKHFYCVGQYYYSGSETGQYRALSVQARSIRAFVENMETRYKRRHSHIFVDPSSLVLRAELERVGLMTERADNCSGLVRGAKKGKIVGVEFCQLLMADGIIKLVDCKEGRYNQQDRYTLYPFLKEISNYALTENGELQDGNDHCLDSMLYAVNYARKTYMPNVI